MNHKILLLFLAQTLISNNTLASDSLNCSEILKKDHMNHSSKVIQRIEVYNDSQVIYVNFPQTNRPKHTTNTSSYHTDAVKQQGLEFLDSLLDKARLIIWSESKLNKTEVENKSILTIIDFVLSRLVMAQDALSTIMNHEVDIDHQGFSNEYYKKLLYIENIVSHPSFDPILRKYDYKMPFRLIGKLQNKPDVFLDMETQRQIELEFTEPTLGRLKVNSILEQPKHSSLPRLLKKLIENQKHLQASKEMERFHNTGLIKLRRQPDEWKKIFTTLAASGSKNFLEFLEQTIIQMEMVLSFPNSLSPDLYSRAYTLVNIISDYDESNRAPSLNSQLDMLRSFTKLSVIANPLQAQQLYSRAKKIEKTMEKFRALQVKFID